MKVIIAEINTLNSYEDFYSKTRKYTSDDESIQKILLKTFESIDVSLVFDFDELGATIKDFENNSRILIFSNFPADNSYKRYKIINDSRHNKTYMLADGYDISKKNYKQLLTNNSNIELYVITGASESLLPKKDIITLVEGGLISYKNKGEWPSFSTDDYNEYIISKIRESL
jgi:hypothetical protein